MTVRLLVFDLDGTLVDSSQDISNAINFAVSAYGIEPVSVSRTISLIGEGVSRLFEKLLAERTPDIGKPVMERFLSYYGDHLTDHTRPYPGVADTMNRLAAYRRAVVSNKRESFSIEILKRLGLARHFELVLGSDSVPEKKPSPAPILHAMNTLSASPDETVVVGDSTFDIRAGRAAGCRTVAVTYGYRHASELKDAHILIDHFPDLLSVLPRLP